MGFNTYPCNPYPISTEELNKGNNDELNARVTALEGEVTDLGGTKANQITIAPFFNPETAYEVGDLVYYNGLSYRCTNAHEGEWDADDFAATTIAGELDTLKSGLNDVTDIELSAFTPATGVALDANANCYIKRRNGFVFGWLKFDGLLTIPSSGAFQIGTINSVNRTSLKTVRVPIYLNTPNDSSNFAVAILALFGTGTVFVIGTPGTYGKNTGSGVESWDTGDGVYFSYPVGV